MKKINLDVLSEDELKNLNRQVVMRLRYLSEIRRRSQLMSFRVGDRVEFETDNGIIEGVVVRVNQKTASIDADDGRSWRVSPHLLRKVMNVSETLHGQTNLFHLPQSN